jgi:hypothetical protein
MPSGATGKDIVKFVSRVHVASVKNDLDRVRPLVKALAAAVRVLEGRIVAPTTLLPVVFALYPSAQLHPYLVLRLLGLSQMLSRDTS